MGHWHTAPTHCCPVGQALPQVLQFFGSLCRFTHAALLPVPHIVRPVPQTQFEPWQVDPLGHDAPHAPQLELSVVVSTQAPAHGVKLVLHVNVHALEAHVGEALATVVEQAAPQVLQLLASLVRSTHVVPQRVGVAAGQPETQA